MLRVISQIFNNKLISAALSFIFVSVFFFSLFHVSIGEEMSGCMFMSHEEILCATDVLNHFDAWKSAFLATITFSGLLLSVLSTFFVFKAIPPNLILPKKFLDNLFFHQSINLVPLFSYRPLQELFSSGILHPKLF